MTAYAARLIARGEANAMTNIIRKMLTKGQTCESIAEMLDIPLEQVKDIEQEL